SGLGVTFVGRRGPRPPPVPLGGGSRTVAAVLRLGARAARSTQPARLAGRATVGPLPAGRVRRPVMAGSARRGVRPLPLHCLTARESPRRAGGGRTRVRSATG